MASSLARKEVVDNNDDYCHVQHREEENDLGAESLTVPVIALKWTILNCDSNHELSTLSNICRSWRDIVSITLLEEEEEEKGLDEREEGKSGEDPDPPVSSLLLPSMMRQLALASSSATATATATAAAKEKYDTFCVSWFEPKGIQVDAVNPKDLDEYISSDESVDEHTSSNKRGNFSSSSSDFFMMQSYNNNNNNSNNMNGSSVNLHNTKSFISQQQYFPNSNNNNHTTDSPNMKSPTNNNNNNKNFSPKKVKKRSVTKSWEGNKSPMDVLLPFGFTNSFVNKIIAKVQESHKKSSKTGNMNSFSLSKTTFAVKGATEARAEVIPTGDGLFFPLDTPIETLITDPSPLLTTTKKVIQSPPSLSLFSNLDNENMISSSTSTSPQPPPPLPSRLLDKNIRMQYKKDADLDRQNRKLKKLRRKLVKIQQKLPRVVLSTPNTSALGSRNVIPLKLRKRQKSVQFLNANGSRAVRMQTSPFECGPLMMPFTIFCVGIATEDGVFLSGLKKRFELGHLYPQNKVDEITEMSSVCIAFDDSETIHKNNNDDEQERERERERETAMGSSLSNRSSDVYHEALGGYDRRNNIDNYGSSSGDETDDDDDAIGISGSFDDDDEEDMDSQPPLVCRGKTGPGLYHCYTAIFDGDQSVIRVDGVVEFDGSTMKKKSDNSSSARFLFGEQHSSSSSPPMLDGLTIGSDHRFDMSLCFGEGDPGEGEGAISELAVFKGRLPDIDLATIEKHMMKKHGIYRAPSTPTPESNSTNDTSKQDTDRNTSTNTTTIMSPWQEDEWRRQAHALIVQPYPYVLSGKNVPLRFLSNHRSVAWHRSCDVTGTALRVSRIGSKLSNGSSDW